MTDHLTNEARIELLAIQGWTLVHSVPEHSVPLPEAGPGALRVIPGSYRFERHWRGSSHSEIGTSLEEALERTEREQRRIASLEDRKPRIQTGPLAR